MFLDACNRGTSRRAGDAKDIANVWDNDNAFLRTLEIMVKTAFRCNIGPHWATHYGGYMLTISSK